MKNLTFGWFSGLFLGGLGVAKVGTTSEHVPKHHRMLFWPKKNLCTLFARGDVTFYTKFGELITKSCELGMGFKHAQKKLHSPLVTHHYLTWYSLSRQKFNKAFRHVETLFVLG